MSDILKVAFVGSGAINFGGAEGPWNHSRRLEQLGGVQIVGIVDPLEDKAKKVLKTKQSGEHHSMYSDCEVYSTMKEMILKQKPDAVLIGSPPDSRGSLHPGKSLELDLMKAGIHAFIEKPLSSLTPEEFAPYARAVDEGASAGQLVNSVGYMFRYHAGVRKMKELISGHGGKVMALNARYYAAYSEMNHPFWWDVSKSGGPVVEQATHFCDLARFLVGEILPESLQVTALRDEDMTGAGKLSSIDKSCEVGVSDDNKPPRVTSATWRFAGAGVGCLMHVIALHGKRYETEIDVLMDGLRLTLSEPYQPECELRVRSTQKGDTEEVFSFGTDDPYLTELEIFLAAVRTGDSSNIASTYSDAAKTYNMTWAIRRESEKNSAEKNSQ